MAAWQSVGSGEHAPHRQTGICLHLPQIPGSASLLLEVSIFGSTALPSIRTKDSSKTALLCVHEHLATSGTLSLHLLCHSHRDCSHSASLVTVSEVYLGPHPHPVLHLWHLHCTDGIAFPLSTQAHTFSCAFQLSKQCLLRLPPMLAPKP